MDLLCKFTNRGKLLKLAKDHGFAEQKQNANGESQPWSINSILKHGAVNVIGKIEGDEGDSVPGFWVIFRLPDQHPLSEVLIDQVVWSSDDIDDDGIPVPYPEGDVPKVGFL